MAKDLIVNYRTSDKSVIFLVKSKYGKIEKNSNRRHELNHI